VITRNVSHLSPIMDFLENAQKFGHKIESLIIVYNDFVNQSIMDILKDYCEITTFQVGKALPLIRSLEKIGLCKGDIETLTGTPDLQKYNMVAYGISRNYTLLTALLQGMDYLIYFDSDVYPKLLSDYDFENSKYIEVDFVGSHLKYLKRENIVVTTSDYSGYFIIPKMNFPNLMELLLGIQKEDRFTYITTQNFPVTRKTYGKNIFNTHKSLGGNMAIDLQKLEYIPPFFSTTLTIDNRCFLGRGEDTLFGPLIYHKGGKCVDIDLLIFHNCFGDFPNKPDINVQKNIDRFYFACMGWLIRNPFFNWVQKEYGISTEDIKYEHRLASLRIGSRTAAKYFNDKRFLELPDAFEKAYDNLQTTIADYDKLLKAWEQMKLLLKN